jgi:glycosyltransferase involved in cell wall biosynthesis
MRFVVIVALFDMASSIEANIRALQGQTDGDFRCLIGDDLSTDDSASRAEALIRGDGRFELVRHTEKKFSMGNIHALIERARPAPEDVVVLVDGDDRLGHARVLERIRQVYESRGCWMTYGSFSGGGPDKDALCRPYPPWTIRLNLFRRVDWRASHLRTFKYGLWTRLGPSDFTVTEAELRRARRRALLTGRWRSWYQWRRIRLESLLDPSGRFTRRCSDKVMTLPMLELAGERAVFVDEVLYHYDCPPGRELDYGCNVVPHRWYTRCIRDVLRHKPRRRRLPTLAAPLPSPTAIPQAVVSGVGGGTVRRGA